MPYIVIILLAAGCAENDPLKPDPAPPAAVTDTIPPAAVTDLRIGAVTTSSALLIWTATGCDGNGGTASDYDIRYCGSLPDSATSPAAWDSAAQVAAKPIPRAAGQVESLLVVGLVSGAPYSFALRASDDVPNWSDFSNVASCTMAVTIQPDEDDYRDAEILAYDYPSVLRPPPNLVELIAADLAAIRHEYPLMETIHATPPWVPGELLVKLTEQAWDAYLAGTYHGLDDLNEKYGPVTVSAGIARMRLLELRFEKHYNMLSLSHAYETAEGVEYAQPNYYVGDGPNIAFSCPPFAGWPRCEYVFRDAWGDCPSGCIEEHVWVFTVMDGQVELVDEWESGDPY